MLALVCLLAFGAFGVFYFRTWVVQKPFAIIIFLGEGLTAQRLAAARVYQNGADSALSIDKLEFSARLRNSSADFAVPDAAAAASAIATGTKVKNGAIALNGTGTPLPTLLELAAASGRATGLVSDGELTNPSVASFYVHAANARAPQMFADALATKSTVDVALGGGGARFGQRRRDPAIKVVRTVAELEEISAWQRPRVLGLFADNDLPFSDEVAARGEKPALADMVRRAIELLQFNRRGYLLVVDAHLAGVAAKENAGERTLRETLELDRAVKVATEYAGANAAILVAGDVAIGGMNVSGYPYRYDKGVAILGLNSSGQPWITWATGPHQRPASANEKSPSAIEPAAVETTEALNTLEDPVASANGLGMQPVKGVMNTTALFSLIRDLF